MWCGDGLPVKYPSFFLVLHNYNTRCQLQGQGRIVINTSDLDVDITVNNVFRMLSDDVEQQNAAGVRFFFQILHTHSLAMSLTLILIGRAHAGNTKQYVFINPT